MLSTRLVETSRTLFLCAFICLLSLSGTPVRAESVLNKIVAFVNGEIITQYDLQAAVAPELLRTGLSRKNSAHAESIAAMEKKVLETLITDELFVQEAEQYGLTVKDSEVENEIRKMAQQNGMTLEEAKDQMKADGVSYDTFADKIRKNIIRSRLLAFMVSRKVVVTKEDVQAYYDEHKADFASARKVAVKMLVFAANTDAAAILEQIRGGSLSFEDAVAQYSIGPAKDQGGLMGDLAWADLSDAWRTALSPLSEGQVSDLVRQGAQTMVLKLDRNIEGELVPLEQVADQIDHKLREPMLEARFEEYTKKLRDKAVVKINF